MIIYSTVAGNLQIKLIYTGRMCFIWEMFSAHNTLIIIHIAKCMKTSWLKQNKEFQRIKAQLLNLQAFFFEQQLLSLQVLKAADIMKYLLASI